MPMVHDKLLIQNFVIYSSPLFKSSLNLIKLKGTDWWQVILLLT